MAASRARSIASSMIKCDKPPEATMATVLSASQLSPLAVALCRARNIAARWAGLAEIGIEKNRHQWNRLRRCHKAADDEVKSMADAAIRRNRARVRDIELLRDQRLDHLESQVRIDRDTTPAPAGDRPTFRPGERAGFFPAPRASLNTSRPNRRSRRAYGLR